MFQKKYYLILDTETTMPVFGGDVMNILLNDDIKRKNVAIARPVAYDMSWIIVDREGNIYDRKTFVVNEIFYNMPMMELAYYSDRRPIYEAKIASGEIKAMPWDYIVEILIEDMAKCDAVGGYNSAFDFCKAIPYTELFIHKMYGNDRKVRNAWIEAQTNLAMRMIKEKYNNPNPASDYGEVFRFRGADYSLFDIWGMACKHLLNTNKYRNFCIENGALSACGDYFSTSAENVFRYLLQDTDFNEAHTGLDDAIIESQILARMTKRHKVEAVECFPFRILGSVSDYVVEKGTKEQMEIVLNALENYLEGYNGGKSFRSRIENKIDAINDALDGMTFSDFCRNFGK